MRNTTARRLKAATIGKLPKWPSAVEYRAAERAYRAAKRQWNRTPTPARMAATRKAE
jgi:hypothetical protein